MIFLTMSETPLIYINGREILKYIWVTFKLVRASTCAFSFPLHHRVQEKKILLEYFSHHTSSIL